MVMFANNFNNYIIFGAEGRLAFFKTAHPALRILVFCGWHEPEFVLPYQNCRIPASRCAKYGHCKVECKVKAIK